MKIPKNIRTYSFWVGLSGALVMLAQSVAKLFGAEVESSLVENIVMSICGVLVVLGIVAKPESSENPPNDDNQPKE